MAKAIWHVIEIFLISAFPALLLLSNMAFCSESDFHTTCYNQQDSISKHVLYCNRTNKGLDAEDIFTISFDSPLSNFDIYGYEIYILRNTAHLLPCSQHADTDGAMPNDCEWTNKTDFCPGGWCRLEMDNNTGSVSCIKADSGLLSCMPDNRTRYCNSVKENGCVYETFDNAMKTYYWDDWVPIASNELEGKLISDTILYSPGESKTFKIEWQTSIVNLGNGWGSSGSWKINPEGWWYTEWSYRKNISVSNTAYDLTNHQVKIIHDFSDAYSEGKINQSCNDIRFTYYNSTSENETELNYWIDSCNLSSNGNATVWVNVTYLENNTNTTIYMYYGNDAANSNSNITSTFIIGDDFDRNDSDTIGNGWEEVGMDANITGNALWASDNNSVPNTDYVRHKDFPSNQNSSIRMLTSVSAQPPSGSQVETILFDSDPGSHGLWGIEFRDSGKFCFLYQGSAWVVCTSESYSADTWYAFEFEYNASSRMCRIWIDGSNRTTWVSGHSDSGWDFSNNSIQFGTYQSPGVIHKIDDVINWKWVLPEITYSVGEEEGLSVWVRLNDGDCNSESIFYQTDSVELIATVKEGGIYMNASEINSTIYLKNLSESGNWTLYNFLSNASFTRTGNGSHEANFTVNNTIGEYKIMTEVSYGDEKSNFVNYFNVSYLWWDNDWQKRNRVDIHAENINGTNLPFGIWMTFDDTNTLNCTQGIRVVHYNWTGLESGTPTSENVTSHIYNEGYCMPDEYNKTYCNSSYIAWNFNVSYQNLTYFIYYGNPLSEKPDDRVEAFYYDSTFGEEELFMNYDSHVDFWWNGQEDNISIAARNASHNAFDTLRYFGYDTNINANANKLSRLASLQNDEMYHFMGHGGIDSVQNLTYIVISDLGYYIDTDDIRDLPKNLEEKFVFLTACFSGDNSSTITECDLNDWLSDAFTDKGVECYMGFLGENVTTSCPNCTCDGDLYTDDVKSFNECFWNEIVNATIFEATEMCQNDNVHAILAEKYPGACNKTLIK